MGELAPVTAGALQAMLADGEELAVVDVREELLFASRHLLRATSVPLSRLELKIAALVPRRATRVVLCDDGDGLCEQAAEILARYGYSQLFFLQGGVSAWAQAGLELFSGVNVPSKAFGEFVEQKHGTASVSAEELHELLRAAADVIVVDSRPFDEYARMSIPTAINVPGAELVLHVRDLAPSPDTMVVVNCAGRTRSIIGAQSLIEAGVPNRVAALRNGTMGWELAGLALERGQDRRAPSPSRSGLIWAKAAAHRVAERLGVPTIDTQTLQAWQAEQHQRSLFLFDVRDPQEYRAGHVRGAASAPGGQLVQATDQFIGTLGARIVLVDDQQVRALMTASWLRRMGWREVVVLFESGNETASPPTPRAEATTADRKIGPAELSQLLAEEAATVIDLSLSTTYRQAHIPGAWFAIRTRLARALPAITLQGMVVLTSEDGLLAALAVAETAKLTDRSVRYLAGGNAAWSAAGLELVGGDERMADQPIDVWLRPYERQDSQQAMLDYLAWETALLPAIARDGSLRDWR